MPRPYIVPKIVGPTFSLLRQATKAKMLLWRPKPCRTISAEHPVFWIACSPRSCDMLMFPKMFRPSLKHTRQILYSHEPCKSYIKNHKQEYDDSKWLQYDQQIAPREPAKSNKNKEWGVSWGEYQLLHSQCSHCSPMWWTNMVRIGMSFSEDLISKKVPIPTYAKKVL